MKTVAIVLLLFFSATAAEAQLIINAEELRLNSDDEGIHGSLSLGVNLRRNKVGQYVDLQTIAALEVLKKRHRIIMLGSYLVTWFNNLDDPESGLTIFTNSAYGHLRYNYRIRTWLVAEAFSQVQRNVVQQINLRYLNGAGPRFKVVRKDSLFLNLGSLYMYEYEESTDQEGNVLFNRQHRWSSYVSFGITPSSHFEVRNVLYYQPRFDAFRDYRLTDELNLGFSISRFFSFQFYFLWVYDAFPPPGVPRLAYSIRNGFRFAF